MKTLLKLILFVVLALECLLAVMILERDQLIDFAMVTVGVCGLVIATQGRLELLALGIPRGLREDEENTRSSP